LSRELGGKIYRDLGKTAYVRPIHPGMTALRIGQYCGNVDRRYTLYGAKRATIVEKSYVGSP